MTQLSDKLYELMDRNPHFSQLPRNHPDVVAVRKQAEMELLDMERKTKMRKILEARELLYNVDRDYLTVDMMRYLDLCGVDNKTIATHIGTAPMFIVQWRKDKNMYKDDLYMYTIFDTVNGVYDKSFGTSNEVVRYLDTSPRKVTQSIRLGLLIHKQYLIEKELIKVVTLDEALVENQKETFQYWLKNEKNLKVGTSV